MLHKQRIKKLKKHSRLAPSNIVRTVTGKSNTYLGTSNKLQNLRITPF